MVPAQAFFPVTNKYLKSRALRRGKFMTSGTESSDIKTFNHGNRIFSISEFKL